MTEETYIRKWLEGNLTEEELREFEKTELYASLQKMQDGLQAYKAPEFDTESEYARLAARMKSGGGKQIRVNWWRMTVGVAAVISLLIVSYVWLFSENIRIVETGIAEKRTVVLPDSSLVILNALSEIRINEGDWQETREVGLKGEAFFQVAKGSDFKVITKEGTVTVLGTQFNVKDRASYYEVICYEGLVSVNSQNHDEKLKPGFLFRSVNGQVLYEENKYYNFPHLLKNESAFFSVPFKEVIEEFERHYAVSVTTRNIDLETSFTGRFTHSDMELALQSVTLPLNLNFELTDNNKRINIIGDTE